MVDPEKCTMQSVLNVDKNAKFHSNLTKTDLYTAEIVIVRKDLLEADIKLNR
jgi:RNA binding exosome subunit